MAETQLALGNRSQARAIVKIVETSYPQFGPVTGEADADLRTAFLGVLEKCDKP